MAAGNYSSRHKSLYHARLGDTTSQSRSRVQMLTEITLRPPRLPLPRALFCNLWNLLRTGARTRRGSENNTNETVPTRSGYKARCCSTLMQAGTEDAEDAEDAAGAEGGESRPGDKQLACLLRDSERQAGCWCSTDLCVACRVACCGAGP
ncbi:hypothetical protein AOQ84DRAFT_407455 [Glonium stellatum]|uniref:Uncharacterized protein n=1 Tax=Glonium stellatum TaxID=574774 RepID=A0A8E2JSN3_9PEZI|nr:hypothetical protein AOQ84DRAFT_407455 [Glonium stellatum]